MKREPDIGEPDRLIVTEGTPAVRVYLGGHSYAEFGSEPGGETWLTVEVIAGERSAVMGDAKLSTARFKTLLEGLIAKDTEFAALVARALASVLTERTPSAREADK